MEDSTFGREAYFYQMVYVHSASCKHLFLSSQVTLMIYLVKFNSIVEDPQNAPKTSLGLPPSLCSTFTHPDKDEAIIQHQT